MTVNLIKAKDHFTAFLNRVLSVSNGLLNDQRTRSTLSVIGRAFSEGLSDAEGTINDEFNVAINQSVPRLFGVQTSNGVKATVTLVFTPNRIDTVNPFTIDAGFKVTLNGKVFQTVSVLTVPPNALNGSVTAQAVNVGESSNIDRNAFADWGYIPGLSKVFNPDPASGGLDAKTIDNLSNDIVNALVNRALLTTDNYTYVAQKFLGATATVVTLPNLGKDGSTYERGSMNVFALNNGVPLDANSKVQLSKQLAKGWATVYLSDILVSTLNINIQLKADTVENQLTLSQTINSALRKKFNTLTYVPGADIDLYDTIGYLYKIPGIVQIGGLQFGVNTEVYEAKDFPLNINQSVTVGKVIVNYISPTNKYTYTEDTTIGNIPAIDDF